MAALSALRLAALLLVFTVLCFAAVPNNVVFTVLGDWGVPDIGRTYTDTIARISTARHSQFTVALGDNFYKGKTDYMGVKTTADPKWKSVFEDQFPQAFFQNPWWVINGNHDYDGNEIAQVQYKSPNKNRWQFPNLYYHFTKPMAKGVTVEFIMIDSHVLYSTKGALQEYNRTVDLKQLKWIENRLKKSKATWKIMFSHHPLYTSKKDRWFKKQLVPLLERHHVPLFINGHVHTFEHAKTKKNRDEVHYVTVGSTAIQGARPPTKSPGFKRVYSYPSDAQLASSCPNKLCRGFVIVTVQGARNLALQFYNSLGKLLHTAKIVNTNKGN